MRCLSPNWTRLALALGLVAWGIPARAQNNPNALPVAVNVDVGSPTIEVSKRGAKAPKGETTVTDSSYSFSMNNGTPTVNVRVGIRIRINTTAIGQEYTIKEKGPCEGLTFMMTQGFIEAHEREHVRQIQQQVQTTLGNGTTYNARMGTLHVEVDGHNRGAWTGRPDASAVEQMVQNLVQRTVDALAAQDQAEYERRSFSPSSLEGQARAKSCEMLTGVVGQMTGLLQGARDSLPDLRKDLKKSNDAIVSARTRATAATRAADAVLAAAKACDLKAFQEALGAYENARKRAEDKIKEATDLYAQTATQVQARVRAMETAIADYERLKTHNTAGVHITEFKPLDKIRDELRRALDGTSSRPGFEGQLEAQKQSLDQAGQRLASAAETVKAAYKAISECPDAKDEKNQAWQTFIQNHRTELGLPAAGDPPAEGSGQNNVDPDGTDPGAPQDSSSQNSNSGITNPQTSSPISYDFGQTAEWAPSSKPLPREKGTQLMIIDLLDIQVPNTQVARVDPVPAAPGFFARVWRALAQGAPMAFTTRAFSPRTLWLDPLGGGGGGQGVTRATRVHAYLISLGSSTGEAFDIQIVNNGSQPVRLTGDGVVVRPIKSGSDKSLRAEIEQVANRRQPVTNVRANAYCLEFKLDPPERGKLFEVAEASAQDAYGPARAILHASRRLQDAGELEPDSDPTDYFHAIRQWTIWVNEQNFTLPRYREAFVERAKKNLRNLRGKWTKELENALTSLVPHRWDEITEILREADQPVPGT